MTASKGSKTKIPKVPQKAPIWMTKLMAESYNREAFLRSSLRETLIYIIFIILITIIAFGMVYPAMYFMTKILKDIFLERDFTNINGRSLTFNNIRSAVDFWAYLESALFDSFYWEYWYDDDTLHFIDLDDQKILYENKLLGVPRLRQLKVTNNSCPVHDYFRRTIYSCFYKYNWNVRDKATFGPGTGTAWNYHSPEETDAAPYTGVVNFYDGSGYYQDLSTQRKGTADIIEYLKENLWITRATRAVFLDFSVYNANLNLFCVVKLIFEFPSTGGIIPSSRFHTLKLLRYETPMDRVVLACEIMFLLFILCYTAEEIREIIHFKLSYLKHFWNYIDLTIISLSYTYLFYSIKRYLFIKNKLEELPNHVNTYPNFEKVAKIQLTFNQIIAVLLFFSYMKIFKYITFNKTMSQLNNTIKNCALDVLGFSVMFLIIFIAYAELGYLLFGTQVESFGSFGTSTFTLLRTILGDFDYMSIDEVDKVLAPMFFLSFIFFVFFILLNMFLAIITDTYAQVKTEIAVAPDEMQMSEYIKKVYFSTMRNVGLSKFVRASEEKKVELNVTVEEIRGALKKCNFTDLEIEMFFARYYIDPASSVGDYDLKQVLAELEKQRIKDEPQPKEEEEKHEFLADGTPLVAIDEFVEHRNQIYKIEVKLEDISLQVDSLIQKLEMMENVRKTALDDAPPSIKKNPPGGGPPGGSLPRRSQ